MSEGGTNLEEAENDDFGIAGIAMKYFGFLVSMCQRFWTHLLLGVLLSSVKLSSLGS